MKRDESSIKGEKLIEGLKLFIPTVYNDLRGKFYESFRISDFNRDNFEVIQENTSVSMKNVMRGLHWQSGVNAQAKLVTVLQGAVIDFVLDLRKDSETFGMMNFVYLDEYECKQFFIPAGFAHGFLSLADNTKFQYKVDIAYNKESERGVNLFSPKLHLIESLNKFFTFEEPIAKDAIILSDKDAIFPDFNKSTKF